MAIVDSQPLYRQGAIDVIAPMRVRIVGDQVGTEQLIGMILEAKPDILVIDQLTLLTIGSARWMAGIACRPLVLVVVEETPSLSADAQL